MLSVLLPSPKSRHSWKYLELQADREGVRSNKPREFWYSMLVDPSRAGTQLVKWIQGLGCR